MATIVEPQATSSSTSVVTIDEPPRPRYVRRPEDLLRLATALVLVVIGTGIALLFQDAVLTFENDVFTVVGGVSEQTRHTVAGQMRNAADIVGDIALIVLVVRRRFRLAGYLVLASILGQILASAATSALHALEPASFSQVASKSVVASWRGTTRARSAPPWPWSQCWSLPPDRDGGRSGGAPSASS